MLDFAGGRFATAALCTATASLALLALAHDVRAAPDTIVGADNNNPDNPFVQPQDPDRLAVGGINQSLRNGDILEGTPRADLLIGGLGVDILLADRGADIFLWKPGDGSDFFDGGRGVDVVVSRQGAGPLGWARTPRRCGGSAGRLSERTLPI